MFCKHYVANFFKLFSHAKLASIEEVAFIQRNNKLSFPIFSMFNR